MKEKVLSLAKGNFIYEPPELLIDPGKLVFCVASGEKTTEAFLLKNRRGTKLKGFGSVDEPFLQFLPVFNEEENRLQIEVDATELVPGETLKGEICLVTDCGEISLPYDIQIISPELKDDKGAVSDYHKLRERFQENPEHAAALFYDPKFRENFLYRDEPGRVLYQNLTKRNTKLQGMEEFLVTMGKKKQVRFEVKHPVSKQKRQIRLDYELQGRDIQDSLQIRVNTWGSQGIRIHSTRNFIEPEVHRIWTDEFVGSTVPLKFRILASRVPAGRRYGSLIIESLYQRVEIRISAHNDRGAKMRKVARARKAAVALLVRTYLAYQERRIDGQIYRDMLQKNRVVIEKLSGAYELAVSGYIAVILEDEPEILNFYQKTERIEAPMLGAESVGVENYILIEYVKYLYTKREESRRHISQLLEAYMDNGYQSIPLFLVALHVNEHYRAPARRAEAVRQQLEQDPGNILLLSELFQVYQEDPDVIHVLDAVTLSVINYGARLNMIPEEMSLMISYLAERIPDWSPLAFTVLTKLYERYGQEDTLRSICSLLIRHEKREKRYFPWFAKGVECHLRLTELFEYYMYTMDYDISFSLPDSVISYFQYENHLNDRCKAYLYAYIVRKREEQPDNFRLYGTHIREYALKKLEQHRITEDIATIYEALFQEGNIQDSLARQLPFVMFKQKLICHNENMESVVVVHAEMEEETVYSLDNGQAVVEIYTPGYQLYFVDRDGNYHAGTVEYQLHKFLQLDKFATLCFEQGSDYVHLLAHLAVKAVRGVKLDEFQAVVLQRVAELGCFRSYMKGRLYMRLYDYYCQQKETTLLLELLEIMPPELIKRERLAEVAATCIYHGIHDGMYEKAEKILSRYGIKGCDKKALLLLVRDRIQVCGGAFDPRLVKWAAYLYQEACFDQEIMTYLAAYYMGSTGRLTAIYKKCSELSKGVVEDGIRERLLGQVLFSCKNPAEYEETFLEYYEEGTNRVLVKAFLSEFAYEYLVDRLTLSEEIFTKIEKEAFYVKDPVMVLAALKYYSKEKSYAWKQQEFIERNLELFASEGRIFPFMKEFTGKLAVPYEIENAVIIQHYSGTDKGVFLHSRTAGGSWQTEPMKKVFDGIYTKELLLFSGEEKTYYIEEEETGEKTDEIRIKKKEKEVTASGFFHMVDEMIAAKEKHDTAQYQLLRREYEKRHAVAAKLFTIQ